MMVTPEMVALADTAGGFAQLLTLVLVTVATMLTLAARLERA